MRQPTFIQKSQPTASAVHVNTPLQQISIAFMQSADSFVADQVFPEVPVSKQSDVYWSYDRGFFNRNSFTRRSPGGSASVVGYEVDANGNYFCHVESARFPVDSQVDANSDPAIDLETDATELLTHLERINREKKWVNSYFKTTVWTTDVTGVAASPTSAQALYWNDDGSNPVSEVRTRKRTVLESTGFEPNTLVISQTVYDALREHPEILDRVKYSQRDRATINTSDIAALMDLERVLVAKGIENTAAEGASNSHSFIMGKHALLVYAAPRPSRRMPSGGYTFTWTGYLGASQAGTRMLRYREEPHTTWVEMESAFDQKLIAADLGVFFDGIVS